MINAIVAVDDNWGIGSKNDLLAHIPEDLKRFRELTTGNTVIMGRKTYDSLPNKPLSNRTNIVLTSKADRVEYKGDHWLVSMDYMMTDFLPDFSLEGSYCLNNVFVMGGGSVYKQLLPYCEKLYITKIMHSYEDVDTYFPNVDEMSDWVLTSESEEKEYNGVKYKFCTYERKDILKRVFILNGCGGVGKDTFVNLVGEYVPTIHFSSVTKVKEVAKMIGWDGGKTEKDRKFLSDLKLLCSEYNDMPLNSMKEEVEFFKNTNALALFLDIREPEEIEIAKRAFNAETILVVRDSVEHISSNMADDNVYNYTYDYIIDNNGTEEDLKECARTFAYEMWGAM